MKRREFIKEAGAVALASVAAHAARAESVPKQSKKPNILLIFSDQQHWRAMGFLDPFFETPNLDKLAKESIVFERSFCTTPQCSPSRSSLLTGFYPSATKVMGNVRAAGGAELDQPTLAPELQTAGYRTGYFGKWHLGNRGPACSGWDAKRFKTDDPGAEMGALEFLRQPATQTRPFALFVSINNPHDIYNFKRHAPRPGNHPLPRSWQEETLTGKPPIQRQFMEQDQGKVIVGQSRAEWEKYRDCYRTKTKLFDENVGKILDELKKQGQWENTIVIVTSDHGDMDAQHRLIFKGPFMYEHMVRVPLMIRLPVAVASIPAQRIGAFDVVNVDIAPTIRELCGLPSKQSDGISLAPFLAGSDDYRPRDFVIGQYYSKQRWVNPIRMIRTEQFKLNRHIQWGDELYDLKKDPDELTNLAGNPEYASVHEALGRKLDKWVNDHRDPFYELKATTRGGEPIDSEETNP